MDRSSSFSFDSRCVCASRLKRKVPVKRRIPLAPAFLYFFAHAFVELGSSCAQQSEEEVGA
eukprot:7918875-Pyramimonas_sp.AAC.1